MAVIIFNKLTVSAKKKLLAVSIIASLLLIENIIRLLFLTNIIIRHSSDCLPV